MNRSVVALGNRLVHTCKHIATLSDAPLLHADNLLHWIASVFTVEDFPDAVY